MTRRSSLDAERVGTSRPSKDAAAAQLAGRRLLEMVARADALRRPWSTIRAARW